MQCYTHKKKRRHIKRRVIVALLLTIAVISAAIAHLLLNVYPILETVSGEEVKNTTVNVMNEALKTVLDGTSSSDELVKITRDQSDNIRSMSVDTVRINAIARDATLIAQSKLKAIGELVLEVPLGTLSGITFLSGIGPCVTMRCTPVGSVNVSFKSVFESAGINSTLYSILMITETCMNVVIPGLSSTITVQTEVPMVDALIVGEVPDTYLNSNRLNEMLNLIP